MYPNSNFLILCLDFLHVTGFLSAYRLPRGTFYFSIRLLEKEPGQAAIVSRASSSIMLPILPPTEVFINAWFRTCYCVFMYIMPMAWWTQRGAISSLYTGTNFGVSLERVGNGACEGKESLRDDWSSPQAPKRSRSHFSKQVQTQFIFDW